VARRLATRSRPAHPHPAGVPAAGARHRQLEAPDPAFEKLLRDAGEIVREEIGTLERLVGEFSAFAKLPEVRPEPADLGEFAEEFARTSPAEGLPAGLEVVRAAGPCPVALDRALLRRVLANLVRNAVEAARPEPARLHWPWPGPGTGACSSWATRAGHPAGAPGADLRPVLHHQGRGHRPGAGHRQEDRPAARRRDRGGRATRRRRIVHALVPLAGPAAPPR